MQTRRPITLADHRWWRFATLCALYFAQGVPYGFMAVAMVSALSTQGATAAETGSLVALALLPWSFKVIWGPIIDSFRLQRYGQRRPWIVLAQFMMAITMLVYVSSCEATERSSLALLGAVLFLHNCFASLQDVATDALAIDLLSEDERGRVNAFMWGAKLLGVSAGGAGIGSIIAATNLRTGMQAQAVLLLAIMLLPLLIRERTGDRLLPIFGRGAVREPAPLVPATNPWHVLRQLMRAFTLRATLLGLVLAFVAFIGEGLSIPINADIFINQMQWSAEHYAHMQAIWGTSGRVVAAIGGGLLCDWLGARLIIAAGALITTLTFVVFALSSSLWTHPHYPGGVYFMFLEGGLAMTTVAMFSLYMSMSWTTAAATQFTLYMTVMNLGNAFGATLTRLQLSQWGTLILAACVSALPLLVLPWINPRSVQERKRDEAEQSPVDLGEVPRIVAD